MLSFNEYLNKVNEAVEGINYPSTPSGLYEPIAYTMSLGGKRIRPSLVLMACDAFCGSIDKAVLPAVGLELYHNFTLLHDDVMDKADLRRGKPTVHIKWDENTAILSGDAMLTMATQFIAKAPANVMAQVMALYNKTAMEIYEGQQYDMDFEQRMDVKEEEYINMIRLKTSVLLGCACKMGAVIGGADERSSEAIYRFGELIGLAFQLQDDLLDVYGDEKTFGKAIGGDILNNKKTFMLIKALELSKGDDKEDLMSWINDVNPNKQAKIAAVTGIYTRVGIKNIAEERIAQYNDEALAILEGINVSGEAKQAFRAFADMLMSRKK